MMAKKPAQRYQEPHEVVDALRPWTEQPIGPPLGNPVTSGPDFLMVWIIAIALVAAAWTLVLVVDLGITRLREQTQARRAVGVQS